MKNVLVVLALLVSGALVGAVATDHQVRAVQTPSPGATTPAAPVQGAKLQDPAVTKLQDQVAMLIQEDRQKTAQIGQLKTQVDQLQTQLAQFKTSTAGSYVPIAGPAGSVCSGGWTGAVNVMKSPTALVYTWYCKTQ